MTRYPMALIFCALSLVLLSGCGGGGSTPKSIGSTTGVSGNKGAGQTTPITLSIIWGERTRLVYAPNSALSCSITLKGAQPGGGDFTATFDRDATALDAYTQTYTSPTPALTGSWPATLTFFAAKGGLGAVVGTAAKQAAVSTANPDIGHFVTASTIVSLTIPTGQSFPIGQAADLIFSALDAKGNVVVVTPGSARWASSSAPSNRSFQQIDVTGHVLPEAPANVQVSVSLDGKTSALTPAAIVRSVKYAVTVLGDTLYSQPCGLNANGDVVGYEGYPPDQATLWPSGGGKQTLGKLPGDLHSIALGINAGGQVVGVSTHNVLNFSRDAATLGELLVTAPSQGFLWTSAGGMQALPLAVANAINDSGQVVGQANNHAALWTVGGGVVDLGNLPGFDTSTALAINNAGQVLCQANAASGAVRSFLWTQAGGIQDIGQRASYPSVARGISPNGPVVGSDITSFNNSWFTWTSAGSFQSLDGGFNSATPVAIADNGQIVTTGGALLSNGFLMRLTDLIPTGIEVNSQVLNIAQAYAINARGQIIAQGAERAILLTPQNGM